MKHNLWRNQVSSLRKFISLIYWAEINYHNIWRKLNSFHPWGNKFLQLQSKCNSNKGWKAISITLQKMRFHRMLWKMISSLYAWEKYFSWLIFEEMYFLTYFVWGNHFPHNIPSWAESNFSEICRKCVFTECHGENDFLTIRTRKEFSMIEYLRKYISRHITLFVWGKYFPWRYRELRFYQSIRGSRFPSPKGIEKFNPFEACKNQLP